MASEVGGTTLASETLGSKAGALNHSCIEEGGGIFEMNRGCVPRGARNYVQHPHHFVGNVRVDYEETPHECVQVVLKL